MIGAVRERWPVELPVFVRLSASDWLEGGLTVHDAIAVTREILPLGVDFIDVSSGGLRPAPIETYPGYQVPFAQAKSAALRARGRLCDNLCRRTKQHRH